MEQRKCEHCGDPVNEDGLAGSLEAPQDDEYELRIELDGYYDHDPEAAMRVVLKSLRDGGNVAHWLQEGRRDFFVCYPGDMQMTAADYRETRERIGFRPEWPGTHARKQAN